MMIELLSVPAIILFVGALLLPIVPKRLRSSVFMLFPLIALAVLWTLPEGSLVQATFATYELQLLAVNSLSRIFGTIFVLITFVGGVYAFHIDDLGQQVTALAYAAGALGVTFAGDFITLFMFWEIMAVASTYLIWARTSKDSDKSGMRYLIVHVVGGGFLLTGILLHVSEVGSTLINTLEETYSLANIFMLIGVAVNSAIPPLHAWLADAYPRATITGAVFLSAFTTKSAVLLLIRLFQGWDILIYAGVIMALYGVVYAVLVNDIREILAYHIISQVGYMVAGVGIGTEMAINGTTAHAFSHILYKSLLFMGAGAVMQATGKSKLTELGGFAKKMPVVVALYMIGAFSISGFPLFNGFISKSMVVSAAGAAHLDTVMLLLTLASVGTFLHTGLKLPYFTWFGEKKSDFNVSPIPVNMKIAMGIGAFLCTLFGVYPTLLYNYLPFAVDYQPYTVYHLVEMMQILVFTFIGFWISRVKLAGTETIAIDVDWLYRKPASLFRTIFVTFPAKIFEIADNLVISATERIADVSKNPLRYLLPTKPKYPIYTDGFTAPIYLALGFILLSFCIVSLFIIF